MSNPHKDQPEKLYPVRFLVEGSGQFPIDMLRYDRAVPETEIASNAIMRDGLRAVRLVRYSSAGKSGPNLMRWHSYRWEVVEVTYSDGTVEDRATLEAQRNSWGGAKP